MNLDEYLEKAETGNLGLKEINRIISNNLSIRILRLYSSYGEAKKTGFYGQDSLRWILSSLEEALTMAGLTEASSLLKKDVNASFKIFWNKKVRFTKISQNTSDSVVMLMN